MTHGNRRDFLKSAVSFAAAGATLTLPPVIQRALAIPPRRRTGTIRDVEHIVVLMQENRSFDHYFGTMNGVRGFGDRFPIPLPDTAQVTSKNVWYQSTGGPHGPRVIAPFRLDTQETFSLMRVTSTPHQWPNAQQAWNDGRMSEWPRFKEDHSMGHFARGDLPFQFALADAFTICDAYHCSFQGGTNPNRLFLWSGTNDPRASGGGPVTDNDFDTFDHEPQGGYGWTTYTERLQAAGVRWQIYQDMADNFTDNPLVGFRKYRDAAAGIPGVAALLERGLTTRGLEKLEEDVVNGTLPQVSFIIATAEGSEHPGPSSPAQGAEYIARVLEALTADPEVWARTVLLVNFDENDGFFDHVPPAAAPSYERLDPPVLAGASTVDTAGEYHENVDLEASPLELRYQMKPYGLGPRVPMYVISPWSKGGYVNSQVFDHTSVIRFIEKRFGVHEPNITAWRRAVCGDLTSAFDFAAPDASAFREGLPETTALARQARALPETVTPVTPLLPDLPVQEVGARPARPLPYELGVSSRVTGANLELAFVNTGRAGAVFHVYDRAHLDRVPRRYTVEAGKRLNGKWSLVSDGGAYDLWVLGPNGFHRHFTGAAAHGVSPDVEVFYDAERGEVGLELRNAGADPVVFEIVPNAYFTGESVAIEVRPHADARHRWSLKRSASWYDFTATVRGLAGFTRRFAGHVETGKSSFTDPELGGIAVGARS